MEGREAVEQSLVEQQLRNNSRVGFAAYQSIPVPALGQAHVDDLKQITRGSFAWRRVELPQRGLSLATVKTYMKHVQSSALGQSG